MKKSKQHGKQKKRSKEKYPSLKKRLNSRVRQEYIDYDYLDQLSDEEKQFLDDFTDEYYGASVGRQKDEGKDNRFHRTKELVKERTDANNSRNRCIYGRIRNRVGATKMLNYEDVLNLIEEYTSKDISDSDVEDAIIDYLDNQSKKV